MADSQIGGKEDSIKLSDNIYIFTDRKIGHHDNVFEGEVKNALYIRPCVIKFATISEQNVREAEILTKLGSHTNVIAIIQSGTYCDVFEDRVYIALDKCHNENLRQYLANRKAVGIEFDLNQAIDFAKQIIVGVMYIHDNNVIHLDLKPSNILISQNLQLIKIADFGLSIVVKSPKSKVLHKRQFGTNGYRPIESFGNGEVSMRTDIFSLGTVLLHLLSNGNDVFGLDEHTFTHNVMNDIADTSGLLVCNPVATEHLIKCMVSKERCRRPSIWEVSDHPCWSGEEVDGHLGEYFTDDEVDDSVVKVETDEKRTHGSMTRSSTIEQQKKFLKTMRKMGFNRKPTLVLFDGFSKQLHRFDMKAKSVSKLHPYPEHNTQPMIAATAFEEYIYVFNNDRSVYRLEYGDVAATWERMTDWIGDHGTEPLAIVTSADSIFLVGESYGWNVDKPSKAVSQYIPRSDQWKRVENKPTDTFVSALLCTKEFLYSVGGFSEIGSVANVIERLDLKKMEWKILPNVDHHQLPIESAFESNGHIYFVECDRETLIIDMYDPSTGQLTEITRVGGEHTPWTLRTFVIQGNLLVAGQDQILKYEVNKNELSVLKSYNREIFVQEAIMVTMS